MKIPLPVHGEKAIPLPHFPTKHQAFIFRAYEYIPLDRISKLLKVTEEKVIQAAKDLGLDKPCTSNDWLDKGYITIIKRMWHILPYEQLLELLQVDEDTLAIILREEDFLDIKLGNKPVCEPVVWRDLTAEERDQTRKIKEIVESVDISGAVPFDFHYDVKPMHFSGEQIFDLRLIYGFSGLYQHAFDVDSRIYCPDELLESYQKIGINGIWTQGILSQLSEFPFDTSVSVGYEARLRRLRDFTERCEKYGIKVYLYLNEPRSMPEPFFEKFPDLRGHTALKDKVCLCTSTKAVQEYLINNVAFVCREVPKIGGFITITRSENPTNCYSHSTPQTCTCPRCKHLSVSQVVAKTIECIEKGAHQVSSDIKVIAWSWAWDEYNIDIIKALPEHVILMSQSELHVPFDIGGISGEVLDYSMSISGPGDRARAEWREAKAKGLEIAAKVQVNTTWECSTVPALPIYPEIEQHIQKIRDEGVKHLMLSWTLGGYPSKNIMHAAKYFYENFDSQVFADAEEKAAVVFARAFKAFPFHISVLYHGPQNAGPSNLLFLEPTGYRGTMTCFAYDDIEIWRGPYPIDVLENQFAKLCKQWECGLHMLEKETDPINASSSEMYIMAHAAYCLFWSSLNQIRFYIARAHQNIPDMMCAAYEELKCTEKMLGIMNKNPTIGFEAANQYYFSKGCLLEKIVNCKYVIAYLEGKK